MNAAYRLIPLLLLCVWPTVLFAQSPPAAIDLDPLTANASVVTISAKMTIVPTLMYIEAVSVAVEFDSTKFDVTDPTSITNKYFTGWDDACVIPWASHVIIYGQYHPNFGAATLLRNSPPELCRFHFYPKFAPGTASFRVYANNATGALTYYFENGFSQQQNFNPVNIANVTNLYYPVELTTFTASQQGQAIALRWVTASETNNYGFFVERRTAEGAVDQDWATLGFVKGSGNTGEETQYLFFDQTMPRDGRYEYRLKQQDFDGSITYHNSVFVQFRSRPHVFALDQNYPNPVSLSDNNGTLINYDVAETGTIRLVVTNILGQPIETLVNELREPGRYAATWRPSGLAAGTYIATLIAEAPESGQAELRHIRMQIVR